MTVFPTLVGYAVFGLALLHAWIDGRGNRVQRFLALLTLFAYGTLLEAHGVEGGGYVYPREPFVNLGDVPLSVSLAWVGIIYSAMIVTGRMQLPAWLRVLATTLIALSLDWGMDPVATRRGFWVWHLEGDYLGVPGFNMVGWFFIPICYLLAYGLAWDKRRRRVRLLSIQQIDADRSWWRRLYTLVLVLPVALELLVPTLEAVARLPFMRHLSPPTMIVGAVVTVGGALGLVVWKRAALARTHWADLLPPAVLTLLAAAYTYLALEAGAPALAALMVVTAAPLWALFWFTWRRSDSPASG